MTISWIKLQQRLAETNLEEGIGNSTGMFGNIATVNVDVNQSNQSTVDVSNSRERKSCACTNCPICADQYGIYQFKEFLGRDCPIHIRPKGVSKL